MEKFRNKYRIPSARLQNWDYGSNAPYFITICTANRENFFGDIEKKMILSEIGKIAHHYWYEIPNHFPFVKLGEFVVMPNHVHGIIIIDKSMPDPENSVETADSAVSTNSPSDSGISVQTAKLEIPVETAKLEIPVETANLEIPEQTANLAVSTNTIAASAKWKPGTLGVILNQYKRIVKINACKIHADFAWQTRFHDHIIQNNDAFQRISDYIINNPAKWAEDRFTK
jgi:putative transposase